MKHLNTYKVFEAINLPIGVNDKPIYPYNKIEKFCSMFNKYFNKIIGEEGWFFGISASDYHTEDWDFDYRDNPNAVNDEVIVISRISYPKQEESLNGVLSFKEAEKCAEKYGAIFNNKGVVYDIDEEKFDKYRHIVKGNELGLL